MLKRYRLRKIYVKPAFSYTLLNIRIPTYAVNMPAINLKLAEYSKNATPVTQYKQEFLRLCATTYGDFQELYTDSSKREAGFGAAVVGLGLHFRKKPLSYLRKFMQYRWLRRL